jgi:MarR family transcriptional regulator, 2-MHQ and catechol-resistance regulon repressor
MSLPSRPLRVDESSEEAGLEADAVRLHRALSELQRVYQFRDRDRICCYDVSVTQCHALDALARRGALTLNELAAELVLDKSTASRVTDALQRKGLLVRAPHPQDRRALQLELTGAGRALVERIEADILEEEKRLLADFAPDVRRAMADLIGRLARAAGTRIDTRGGTCCRVEEPQSRETAARMCA